MRRVLAFALVALFVLQSSGAAMASPVADPVSPPLLAQVELGFAQVLRSFENTYIGAVFSGQAARYAKMHAAPPARLRLQDAGVSPQRSRNLREAPWRLVSYGMQIPRPRLANVRTVIHGAVIRDPLSLRAAKQRSPISTSICPFAGRPQITCCTLTCTTPPPRFPTPAPPPPTPIPTPTPATVPTPVPTLAPTPTPVQAPTGTPVPGPTTAPTPNPTGPSSGTTLQPWAPTGTGVNSWWTYEVRSVPGVGRAMANIGNGNLVFQVDDVDVPERGIDLAFRRTYNSQSQHDWHNADGEGRNVYGNGWTNNFEAHLVNGPNGDLSIYDGDGARYDYAPDGTGGWIAPPGQHATLKYDGTCGYDWTKMNGTTYQFWSPNLSTIPGCTNAAYGGRIAAIYGRNLNNSITLNYTFDNNNQDWIYLNTITAQHSDGQALTLHFADVTTTFGTIRLLHSLSRPDGAQVTYGYDSTGNLQDVCEIGNGSTSSNSGDSCFSSVPSGQSFIHHQYAYYSGTHQLNWVNSSNWVMSNYTAGTYEIFAYDSNNRLTSITKTGTVNPTIADGVSSGPIQSGVATGVQQYWQETFTRPSATETDALDTDGHSTKWYYDVAARIYETNNWTGRPNNLWLLTYQTWDSNNNPVESVDARGNTTDFAYDTNGNTVAVGLPSVTTNVGTFRPTALYSYDEYNNVVASCDPDFTNQIGKDWTANPGSSDSLCPNQLGATRYTYDYSDSSAEPFGRLSAVYTPVGYQRSVSYSTAAQGGDYGLPTDVNGTCISESDGTNRCPHQGLAYDSYGNVTYFGGGVGNWTFSYDALNRLLNATDPDGVASYTCYYTDGETQYTETASQHASDGSPITCQSVPPAHAVAYTYDADGNELNEVHHYGNVAGTTTKWYDGEDRLVEVALPHDATSDLYSYAWMMR